jgi:hypothetical protein
MTGGVRNLRSDGERFPDFIMARRATKFAAKGERLAEWLLLIWLKRCDPNILGLRCVDEGQVGCPVAIVHIAVPLEYKRRQLAHRLGIDQLADEQHVRRVNLTASAGWDEPYSYIRVHSDIIVSHVLAALKAAMMQPRTTSKHAVQAHHGSVQSPHSPRPKHCDENSWLRSAVKEGLAERNTSIEPDQIQILTHRESGEKWIRISNVDRSRRTPIRLAIKRAGINASVALSNDVEGSDWSIRFAAGETAKLFIQSSDSFDVQAEHETLTEHPGEGVSGDSSLETAPTVRLFSPATMANTPCSRRGQRLSTTALEHSQNTENNRVPRVSLNHSTA